MMYSVATTFNTNDQLLSHLLRGDGQEDLCFALWRPSTGGNRITALVFEVILPLEGERNVHGNASFNPEYFKRVIDIALEKEAGVVFLHSHLGPGWQFMSQPDMVAETGMAPAIKAATGLPLLGMTAGTDGAWSARFWIKEDRKYKRCWCSTVRVFGDDLKVTFADHLLPIPSFKEEFKRTRSAWGDDAQAKLMRLSIGIIGLGSVGSVVAEALARMGVQHIKLIDFDIVKKHNLDRHLHATVDDVGYFKTHVVSDRLKKIATSQDFKVDTHEFGITEEGGLKAALDCDILFSCVDRPWPRHVLNSLAYWHLIPVIDGGVGVKQGRTGSLRAADWKAHVVGPNRRCLECLEQYSTSDVSLERDGSLDNPSYIETLDENHQVRRNENVIAFSLNLASLQLLQSLSMIVNPLGLANTGEWNFHFVTGVLDQETGKKCSEHCLFQTMIGLGDKASIEYPVTGHHKIAEETRKKAMERNLPAKNGIVEKLKQFLFD